MIQWISQTFVGPENGDRWLYIHSTSSCCDFCETEKGLRSLLVTCRQVYNAGSTRATPLFTTTTSLAKALLKKPQGPRTVKASNTNTQS